MDVAENLGNQESGAGQTPQSQSGTPVRDRNPHSHWCLVCDCAAWAGSVELQPAGASLGSSGEQGQAAKGEQGKPPGSG